MDYYLCYARRTFEGENRSEHGSARLENELKELIFRLLIRLAKDEGVKTHTKCFLIF